MTPRAARLLQNLPYSCVSARQKSRHWLRRAQGELGSLSILGGTRTINSPQSLPIPPISAHLDRSRGQSRPTPNREDFRSRLPRGRGSVGDGLTWIETRRRRPAHSMAAGSPARSEGELGGVFRRRTGPVEDHTSDISAIELQLLHGVGRLAMGRPVAACHEDRLVGQARKD